MINTADDLRTYEQWARDLDATGRYRVLRRFEPVRSYSQSQRSIAEPIGADALKFGLFVDVETTGLDTARCSIIEFGAVLFTFDHRTGEIFEILRTVSAMEDPGFPIPPEITELTGITDADVKGRKIDDAAVEELAKQSDAVIAFNAEYDRPVTERRFPWFVNNYWACAMNEVPWGKFGARGKKHDYLLGEVLHLFHDAHRAVDDCQAGVHLLATPQYAPRETDPCSCAAESPDPSPDCIRHGGNQTPFKYLLRSVMTPRVRVFAMDSPFAKKELLRAHKYRWSDGTGGRRRGWYRDVAKECVEAERAWLLAEVYQSPRANIHVAKISARDRYSIRA